MVDLKGIEFKYWQNILLYCIELFEVIFIDKLFLQGIEYVFTVIICLPRLIHLKLIFRVYVQHE